MTTKRDVIDLYASPFAVRWTDQIQDAVSISFGVSEGALVSQRKDRRVAYARFAAMHLIRKYRHYSLPKIGQMFGGRDHTSVIHAMRRVKELEIVDAEFTQKLHDAEAFLIGKDTSKVWPADVVEYLKSSPLVA